MHKIIFSLLFVSTGLYAMSSQAFHENADLNIRLSNSNYNRLVVKQDKIIRAHFPEGTMAVKGEEDGSLYVMVRQSKPFTLFLSTEHNHHLSATVSSEDGLGKTIEFVPIQASTPQNKILTVVKAPLDSQITQLITRMQAQKEAVGFQMKHQSGHAIRSNFGLVLLPKLSYQSKNLKGTVIEVHNRSAKTIHLQESWFKDASIKAIAFSTNTLLPKQHAFLYRIQECQHG